MISNVRREWIKRQKFHRWFRKQLALAGEVIQPGRGYTPPRGLNRGIQFEWEPYVGRLARVSAYKESTNDNTP